MASNSVVLDHIEDGKVYELEFGETWHSSKHAYHTVKYDFKPASVLKSDQAELAVGANQDVSITIPNVEGSSSQSTKFSGNTKPYTAKECLMIVDPRTGKIVLERLSANVRVKNVRVENRSAKPTTTTATAPVPAAAVLVSTEKKQSKTPSAPKPAPAAKVAKPTVNAPMKPMPSKRTQSPTDDRLSDEESSPTPASGPPPPVGVIPTSAVLNTGVSHETLAADLQLSDTSDEDE